MSRRQIQGSETRRRLRDWDRGQAAAERLAAHILRFEGYASIAPAHPLGGPHGLKDVVCIRDGVKWVGTAYFRRGREGFGKILSKFNHDPEGVTKNDAAGIAFVTNQELTLSQRGKLEKEAGAGIKVDLLHLERIALILDHPVYYGLRLEYLDIEMTKEGQLVFIEAMFQRVEDLRLEHEVILSFINSSEAVAEQFRKFLDAFKLSTETPKEPYYVTPIYIDSLVGGLTSPSARDRLHKCSSCGYGFFVKGQEHGLGVVTVFSSSAAVSCPKCGNVDEVCSYSQM